MQTIMRLYAKICQPAYRIHRGQTLSEYALIFLCIAVALIGGYQLIGNNLGNSVNGVTQVVSSS
jgi:Flp pilus assembly pilin Flp